MYKTIISIGKNKEANKSWVATHIAINKNTAVANQAIVPATSIPKKYVDKQSLVIIFIIQNYIRVFLIFYMFLYQTHTFLPDDQHDLVF